MQQEYNKYNFVQERSDYLTPPELIDVCFDLLAQMGFTQTIFDLDTCCSQDNIPAIHRYYDGVTDGLSANWCKLNYCNPPYKTCDKWIKKAFAEFENGKSTVMLIPARTETKYWQDYILKDNQAVRNGVTIHFLRKGWCFLNPDTREKMGVFKNALAIVIFDGRSKNALRAVA